MRETRTKPDKAGPFTLVERPGSHESQPRVPTVRSAARKSGGGPRCRCHGEPSLWHRDVRKAAGGYWRCAVKRRQADARYDLTEKRRVARYKYKASEKGRATQERYRLSDKGRATERRRIVAAATRRRAARIEERMLRLDGFSSLTLRPSRSRIDGMA